MAGVLAAATTGGAVVALAWRAGSAVRPFVEVGRAVVGAAPRSRGPVLLAASALVALLAAVVHSAVLPAFRLGFGLGVFPLHGAPLVFLYTLFALALAAGIRLAR